MKHTLLLILGVAIFILFLQDLIRILADSSNQSILEWLPGGRSAHIAFDIVLILAGGKLASLGSKKPKS